MVATMYDATGTDWYDHNATTATATVWITHSSCSTNAFIDPGYWADDGSWFSSWKDVCRWNNILHDQSTWQKKWKSLPPKTVKLVYKRFAVRNYQSVRQQYQNKRRTYVQKLRV